MLALHDGQGRERGGVSNASRHLASRRFVAAIAEVPDLMPLPPGFCFITGFGPATRTLEKIDGALVQPIKVVTLVHNHHGTSKIAEKDDTENDIGTRLLRGGNITHKSTIHKTTI